jgi:hypothetical protein
MFLREEHPFGSLSAPERCPVWEEIGVSYSADNALLTVNDLVRMSIAGNAVHGEGNSAEDVRSRIENILTEGGEEGRTRYFVAAPRYGGDVEMLVPGTVCTLEWPAEQGIWILPVSFIEQQEVQEGLRIWVVDVIGPARHHERREYVRVLWEVPITMTLMSTGEVRKEVVQGLGEASVVAPRHSYQLPHSWEGKSRDLSEGGICVMTARMEIPEDLAVVAEFELNGEPFSIPSRVIRARETGVLGTHPLKVVLAFDNPAAHGDRMRPLLFAEQLRLRRSGLS